MRLKAFIGIFLVAALTLVSSSALGADDETRALPWERFSLSLGGFTTALDSNARIGSKAFGAGIDIDMEDALGLDSSVSVFRARAGYRFGKQGPHRVTLDYFDIRRKSEKVLEKDIEWNDKTYTIGTRIQSYLNTRVFKTSYSYSFFLDDRFDLAASLGVYIMPIEVGIRAARDRSEEEEFTAPLPVLGLSMVAALTPKVFLRQEVSIFYLEYDDFKGSVIDSTTAIEYKIRESFGLGLGLNYFHLGIKARGEDYPAIDLVGEIKYDYTGILFYAKYYYL